MNNSGSFLRDDTKSWVSSNLFFLALNNLNVQAENYYLPTGTILTNHELLQYTETLLDEIAKIEFREVNKESKDYCRKIAFILRAWGREGHGVKLV